MLQNYIKRAYLSYGEIAQKIAPNFKYVMEDLKKSGLKYTLEEYLSLAIFISLIVFVVELPIITLILSFFINVVFAIILSFIFSGFGAILIFFLFTTYPKTEVASMASEIDKGLPFSVSYMSAASSSDSPPIDIFRSVSNLKEYPRLREQATNVIRDVDGLGMDILTALRRESKRTPSKEFKDLLLGLEATISSGANMTDYLTSKSTSLFTEYQRRIKSYADLLSMLIEIYITVIIIGPIFFTILSSVMAMMGGIENVVATQALISFIIMPLMSTALAFYISVASP